MNNKYSRSLTAFEAPHATERGRDVYSFVIIGMIINLSSIYIGNPYFVSLITIFLAAIATIKLSALPVQWIILVSVIAANPVNLSASIALNVIFATWLLMLKMNFIKRLPTWLYVALLFSFISILGSSVIWISGRSADGIFTQLASIGNYIVGPFFLIPLIYLRLKDIHDPDLLLKGFVFSLIVPTIILLLLARTFGEPVSAADQGMSDYLVNISVYHFGNVDFALIRTQVGIVLATLICASFAVIICKVSPLNRLTATGCLTIAILLLLVTGSIGSSIAALSGVAAILLVGRQYISVKRYLVITVIISMLGLIGWDIIPEGIKEYVGNRYVERFSGEGVDASDRIILWRQAFAFLLDNPLGVGWALLIEPMGSYPHNEYLSYAIAFGFICGFIYFFVIIHNWARLKPPALQLMD